MASSDDYGWILQPEAETVLAHLVNGSFDDEWAAIVAYSLDALDSRIASLQTAFPARSQHTIAVKANGIAAILRHVRDCGLGAEAASLGEVALAIRCGFSPEQIVYDSPAKTPSEIEAALEIGVTINANSLDELSRIDRARKPNHTSRIGVRLNPQIGTGTIRATSTATRASKFGIPLDEPNSPEIVERILRDFPYVSGTHVHIGSQGMAFEQLVEGVALVVNAVQSADTANAIETMNIGGGLPALYEPGQHVVSFAAYRDALESRAPSLFTDYTVVTEFGRSLHANNGWIAARIEYVLPGDSPSETQTLIAQLGADMFIREVYTPADWPHRMEIIRVPPKQGPPVTGRSRYRIAGPLCFAGDYICRDAQLSAGAVAGDYLVVFDAGAYTFSMWSHYNSRQFPAVVLYRAEPELQVITAKRRQSIESVVDFWC